MLLSSGDTHRKFRIVHHQPQTFHGWVLLAPAPNHPESPDIQKALEDGVIEPHEAEEIHEHHRRHLAAREEEIRAIVALFSRKKSQKK